MKKFAVIIPYFGQFRPSVSFFLESCKLNLDIDWHIFTDYSIPENIVLSPNIVWHNFTLDKFNQLASEKLCHDIVLERPYKLCDIKPFYGIIFSDYISSYEYWGFGDMDVIYGNVIDYLQKIQYFKYDKINWMGHFCFIRNNEICNNVVLADIDNTVYWKDVVSTANNIGFDERDYNTKFLSKGLKIYNGKWAADIDIFYWRMRCVDKKTLHLLLDTWKVNYAPKNHPYQIFAVLNGRTFRVYLKNKRVYHEEFAYIHFRKEVPVISDSTCKNYLITRDGFIKIDDNHIRFSEYNVVKAYIEKYNLQENPKQDFLNFIYQLYRKLSGKRGW